MISKWVKEILFGRSKKDFNIMDYLLEGTKYLITLKDEKSESIENVKKVIICCDKGEYIKALCIINENEEDFYWHFTNIEALMDELHLQIKNN